MVQLSITIGEEKHDFINRIALGYMEGNKSKTIDLVIDAVIKHLGEAGLIKHHIDTFEERLKEG